MGAAPLQVSAGSGGSTSFEEQTRTAGRAISRARRAVLWLHRWVGLAMAIVLLIEGVTGSLLAFRADLTRWLSPVPMVAPPTPGARPLDLGTLAEKAEAILRPNGRVAYFGAPADGLISLRVEGARNPATGKDLDLGFAWIILDAYTGKEIRRLSTYTGYSHQGVVANIMPFVYDLHTSLTFGDTGNWILGIVALSWTIDCFGGAFLTLPATVAHFWRRWRPSWRIKRHASVVRLNFDLHRAGGLWFWPLLLIFAWSSVELTLLQVYEPITRLFVKYSGVEGMLDALPNHPQPRPALSWTAAQAAGDRIIARLAAAEGVHVKRPMTLAYFEANDIYSYSVQTDRQFPGFTELGIYFNGDTGELVSVNRPNEPDAGAAVTSWLRALHLVGDPVDNLVYRWLVCVVGLVIAAISGTGVYIWWKKRSARRWSLARQHSVTAGNVTAGSAKH